MSRHEITERLDGGQAPARPLSPGEVLRIRPFVVLYLNAAVVFLGIMAQTVARGWLAFELTGTNAALGGVLLAFGVTMLLVTPWGGVAADRLPKRLVLQIAVTLLAVSSAWIGLSVAFDIIQYWMLLVAGAVQAVGFALFNPARMAFLAEILPTGSVPTGVSFGTAAVFLACAALATVGLLLSLALPPGRRSGASSDRSPLGELVDGIGYVRRRPTLTALLWCGIGVTMVGLPYLAFLPTVASELFHLGSAGYGILSATSAVGAVATGLLLGRRTHRGGQTRLFVAAGAVFGLALLGLAAAPAFWMAVVMLLVIGGAMLAFQTTNQSLLFALSDMEYHGRIQGLVMLSFGAFGIAALPLGVLADHVGLRWTVAGMGAGVLALVAVFAVTTRRRLARTAQLLDLG
jgi:MFS family permease